MKAELSGLAIQGAPVDDGPDARPLLHQGAGAGWRALSFAGPVAGLTLGGLLLAVLATAGVDDGLRWPLLALLLVNLLYMALTAWPGLLGGVLRLRRGRPVPAWAEPSGRTRTALVMPVYEENPAVVFAAVEAMARDMAEAGLRQVDIFVLSDTQSSAGAATETAAYAALCARMPDGPVGVHYRRRLRNSRRKVGNIAEFCEEWGGHYDYMLVLDADSLMGARTVRTLIGLMDDHPRTGIIQTVPYPVGRETPFARAQQFAARLYTPMLAEGLRHWQGPDANYWGHNAIIRIAPFVEHCELPVLRGREPFGGEILCHDVVEAGLMRGAGWDVWTLPDDTESFEALPANMVDFAVRERRWCQGNLQHLMVVGRPGLRPVGRYHLAYGIFCYLAGPGAAAFLLLGTFDLLRAGGDGAMAALLGGGAAAWGLAALVFGLLYGFKLAALGAALADADTARSFGGRLALVKSAACEQLGAFVLSPVLAVFYTWFVGGVVSGQSVRWDAQQRDDRGLGWDEAWARLRVPTLAGVAWLAALCLAGPAAVLWAAPLWAGLLMCVPASVWSSRIGLGRAMRRAGLFATPEEVAPPSILRTAASPRPAVHRPRLRLVAAVATELD